MKKLIGEAIPEAEPKPNDFLIKKLIGEAIPESEPNLLIFLLNAY